jgi:hypothetical protein
MKTTLSTLAALLGLALTAAAQSSAGSSGTARIGGVTAPEPAPQTTVRTTTTAAVANQAQMFRQLDVNSDGTLSLEEFSRMPLLNDMDGQPASTRTTTTTATGTTTSTNGTTTTIVSPGRNSGAIISGPGSTTTTLTTTSSSGEPNAITRPTTNTTNSNPGTPNTGTATQATPTIPDNRTGTGSGAGVIPR